jgi:predicted permease
MKIFWLDLRAAVRALLKSPGVMAVAVVTLALGIGANTAIFSAVEAVLLHPLPYADPGRLVMIWEDASYIGFAHNTPAPANFADWRAQNQVFTDVVALRYSSASLTGDPSPEQALGGGVTPNFFDVLGVQPALGRRWTEEEDAKNSKVVVLSYTLWQRRYGSDPNIVGRGILMNGEKNLVLGVMPKEFYFPIRDMDYWYPASFSSKDLAQRGFHFLNVFARLKPGITRERAQRDMDVIAKQLADKYPDANAKIGAVVVPLQEDFAGEARIGLWVLQIGSGFVLLIACSNLANLLLARASSRRREMAIRLALGASRRQVMRQLLAEGLLLSLAGGALGLWLGDFCWQSLGKLAPHQMAGATFSLDTNVLLFTLGISVASAIFFSLAPALRSTRISVYDALKEGARAGESRSGMRLRDMLVIGQFALAFALVVAASLMIKSLLNLYNVPLGFRPDHLLTAILPLPRTKYDTDPKIRNFYRDTLANLRGMPGIESAGFTSDAPFTSIGDTTVYTVEGAPPRRPGQDDDTLYREVTHGYLEAIGATLREGRFLGQQDHGTAQPVAVVNEFLAKRHWPGQSAIGKRVRVGGDKTPWRVIVGVVANIAERGLLLRMKPAVYLSTEQVNRPGAEYLVVRTRQDPTEAANTLRSAVWAVDAQQPLARIRTMDHYVEENLADRKRPMVFLGVFAGLALVLACMGVYSVLAFAVARRTREIGVRMALGAQPLDVTRMILIRGLKLGLAGLLGGGALAIAAAMLLRSLLYGVKPLSPEIYVATAVSLLLVAVLACLIPAQRAARVDPVVALRDE